MTSTGAHSITLRPHQQAAYDAAKSADHGIIKMFCGTGKTRIMLRLITDNTRAISIIVFPRIALVEQFKKDYLENADFQAAMSSIATLCICSEDNATTNKQEIREFIESDMPSKLFCITYQSLEILIGILESSDLIPDIVLFDEAHHVVSPVTYNLLLTSCMADTNQLLYFTATPTEEMDVDEDEVFGPVLFSYTHREAVKDEICNKFEILIHFAEGDLDKNLYDHTAAAYKLIPNGRILAFHSFAEAEREGRTSVVQFRGAAAKKRCNEAFGRSVRLEAVTAKTKDKNAILQDFEATADDDIFMLHNCNILGEGIDTKTANAVLFADPKSSVVQIVQNVGRITRKPAGVKRPASVIIPISVDMSRFRDLDGAGRHAAICEEITKGRFQTIQTVLGALRQEDEEIMDIILKSPDRYTPKEVEQTFKAAGYAVTGEAASLGALCGINATTEEEVAAAIGRPIEIHGQSMETPIRTIGDGANPLKVMHNEDAGIWSKMEREDGEAEVKAPRRPFKIKFAVSEEFGIKWGAKDFIDAVGSAIIDCTVINGEERAMKKAHGCLEFYKCNERLPSSSAKNRKGDSEEERINIQKEQSLGAFIYATKAKLNGNSYYQNKIVYQAVIDFMDKNLPSSWRDVKDLEKESIQKAVTCYEWYKINKRLPIAKANQRKSNDRSNEESYLGLYLKSRKNAYLSHIGKKVYTGVFYESVHNYLDENIPDWRKDINNEEISMQKAFGAYKWYLANGNKFPSHGAKGRKVSTTLDVDKLNDETAHGQFLNTMRGALKGKNKSVVYPNVIKYLDNNMPGWQVVGDFESKALEQAKKIVEWYSKYNQMPRGYKVSRGTPMKLMPGQNISEIDTEYNLGIAIQRWRGAIKGIRKDIVYPSVKIYLDEHIPGWLGIDSASTTSEETTQDIIEHVQEPVRVHKKPAQSAGVQTGIKHTPSALEVYHQRFKTMNSSTYANAVTSEEWVAYHKEADKYDARDPESRKPINRLATLCAKYLRPNCRVADLGCGRNQLRTLAPQFRWTSVDVHAADPTVHVTDIGSMPSDWDGEFNAAILGRSLWARDHMTQLREAFRVLSDGGILIICESVNRWPNNTLIEALEEAGFHIKNVEETSSEDPFQYIVAQRPLCK